MGKYKPRWAFPSRASLPLHFSKGVLSGFSCLCHVDLSGRGFALKPFFLVSQCRIYCACLIKQISLTVTPASSTFALPADLNKCVFLNCLFPNPSGPFAPDSDVNLAKTVSNDSECCAHLKFLPLCLQAQSHPRFSFNSVPKAWKSRGLILVL